MLIRADLSVHRVCVVTIIRLILSTQLELNDNTYDILKLSIVAIVEPLLAIIVACLPFFPLAIECLMGRMRESRSVSPKIFSSNVARLRLKRSNSAAFQSLDDSLPLTNPQAKRTQNQITGPSGKPDDMLKGYGGLAGVSIPPQSSIMVEQKW